jgi:hypothetical protein
MFVAPKKSDNRFSLKQSRSSHFVRECRAAVACHAQATGSVGRRRVGAADQQRAFNLRI